MNKKERTIMSNINNYVKQVYNALDSKKAIDIKIIDIKNVSFVADYFIIASASNTNQLEALQDEVDRIMHEKGIYPKQIEGSKNSSWILLDYSDFIVHLFTEEGRDYYDIERIWRDGIVISENEL